MTHVTDLPNTEEAVLRVKSTTVPKDLAAAIAHACYEGKPPVIRTIGASASNQALKAMIIASQYLIAKGKVLTFRPGWEDVKMPDGDTISAITLTTVVS